MLTPITQPTYIEKILRNAAGEQVRVVFAVSIIDGRLDAQVVSVEKLTIIAQEACLCLPSGLEAKTAEYQYIPGYTPVVSPYNQLFFFDSQPTRAPAYVR